MDKPFFRPGFKLKEKKNTGENYLYQTEKMDQPKNGSTEFFLTFRASPTLSKDVRCLITFPLPPYDYQCRDKK